MLESILINAGLPILFFVVGFVVRKYIIDTENELLFRAVIQVVEAVLERFDIDIPDFLRDLLEEMHKIKEDTGDYEDVLLDEINRLDK